MDQRQAFSQQSEARFRLTYRFLLPAFNLALSGRPLSNGSASDGITGQRSLTCRADVGATDTDAAPGPCGTINRSPNRGGLVVRPGLLGVNVRKSRIDALHPNVILDEAIRGRIPERIYTGARPRL